MNNRKSINYYMKQDLDNKINKETDNVENLKKQFNYIKKEQ